jgi:hypothetical protein
MSERPPTIAVRTYEDRRHAHVAVERLLAAGFLADDVGFVMPEGDPVVEPPLMPKKSMAGEGATTGGFVGGALGALTGAALASLVIPGVGPVLAGGLLLGALEGTLTGAVGGGVLGALVGLRVPEEQARGAEKHFHSGQTIVTVRAGERYDEAVKILRQAEEVPEVTDAAHSHRHLSDNDLPARSGSVSPGVDD